jgi:nucleotide-binding universal stress UspA family protein
MVTKWGDRRLFDLDERSFNMKLLVGIERSDRMLQTLKTAVEHARASGDDLTVAVIETENGPSIERLEQEVRKHLSDLAFASNVEVRSLSGHTGSQLVDLAEDEDFDRIIIDGGQTSPLGKIQIEDVTEFVLLNASITVTLVR